MSELIDTHIHLDFEQYRGEEELILKRAFETGVTRVISIGAGSGFESTKRACALAEKFKNVFAAVGVHPHDAAADISFEALCTLADNPKVVAIGETGLDYFKEWSPKDKQKEWFIKQIQLARTVRKPLIIHSREAAEDCIETLIAHQAKDVGGVFHCYSEDAAFAARLREIHFLVSFTGNITFKKATSVRDAARDIPLDQIMVETDGPFMAPVPYRGGRAESAHVVEIAKCIAQVKGISYEAVCRQTTENAEKLFKLNEIR